MILEISSGFSCIVVSSPLNSLYFVDNRSYFLVCCISLDDTFLYRRKLVLFARLPGRKTPRREVHASAERERWRANARLRFTTLLPRCSAQVASRFWTVPSSSVPSMSRRMPPSTLGRSWSPGRSSSGDRLQLLAQLLGLRGSHGNGRDGRCFQNAVRGVVADAVGPRAAGSSRRVPFSHRIFKKFST